MPFFDLTKPINSSLTIFKDGLYSDPALVITEWCNVESQGYQVSKIQLGTQTGTHIDAPAHFKNGGTTLDALSIEELIGSYFLIDLANGQANDDFLKFYKNEKFIFLRGQNTILPQKYFAQLLKLPPKVWIVDAAIQIENAGPFFFHQALAEAGIFLIEDLNSNVATQIPQDGELIALPLALTGTSGAPCRVVVRTKHA